MSSNYPTTDPKYNDAYFHWEMTAQQAIPSKVLDPDTCANILQNFTNEDLAHLCSMLFVKKIPRTKVGKINAIVANRGEHGFWIRVTPLL